MAGSIPAASIEIRHESRWWWHVRIYDDVRIVDAYGAFRRTALRRARQEWNRRLAEEKWEKEHRWEIVQ